MKSNGWAFIMPAMVMIGLFMIYPILPFAVEHRARTDDDCRQVN